MESYQAEAEIRVKMATKRVDEVEEQHKVCSQIQNWLVKNHKAALSSIKGSKMELEKTTKRLKEAKEEAETIRTNCNQIIQKYQVGQLTAFVTSNLR